MFDASRRDFAKATAAALGSSASTHAAPAGHARNRLV